MTEEIRGSNVFKIVKVVWYGSLAKGNFRPGSVIDLTLVGANTDQQLLG